MLKKTDIKLDRRKYCYLSIVESVEESRNAVIDTRKANNKYMKDKYDAKKPSVFLGYFDGNNEYGYAMEKYLL